MVRDTPIPLILWVCAAVCMHYIFAQGGNEVAVAYEDKRAILKLSESVQDRVRQDEQTFELDEVLSSAGDAEDEPPTPPEPERPKPPEPELKKPDEKAPEQKVEPEKKKVAVVPAKPDTPKLPEPPKQKDHRIAVRQHVKPNQADNPNARFIGDQANKVDEETVATQTSHDQDHPNPTPGGEHAGPKDKVGDSDDTKIAESEEHAGEPNKAPGEKGTEFDIEPMAPAPPSPTMAENDRGQTAPHSEGARQAAEPAPAPGAPDSPGVGEPEPSAGSWSFNPLRPGVQGGVGSSESTADPKKGGARMGFGAKAPPGSVNLNLNQRNLVAIVGEDNLRRARVADGERRRSRHRGAWHASTFQRWRSAIENYVTTVKPGNQTALNTAAVPFASYLNGMHNRIHPIFGDTFLMSLEGMPKGHPLSDMNMITRLEIVLSPSGQLVKMGVVKTSGVTAFDVAALDSVNRAGPFGPAPNAIISPDGRVYLHWEFHRDPVYACSTMNARPFILRTPAKGPAPPPSNPIPKGRPPSEDGIPPANLQDTRQGMGAPSASGAKLALVP